MKTDRQRYKALLYAPIGNISSSPPARQSSSISHLNKNSASRCLSVSVFDLKGGRAVRLFGNAESIAAIYKKLQALDNTGAEINNLLLILDKESLKKDIIQNSHAYILPPVYERGDKPLWCHQRFNNE